MAGDPSAETASKFSFLPKWRMASAFPWQVWSVGWLAVFKAVLWLSTDPILPAPLDKILAAKYALAMVPFLVLGVGAWNLRKWAAVGLILMAAADMAFYFAFKDAMLMTLQNRFLGLVAILLVFNGPVGDILILLAAPVLLKNSGKAALYIE